MKVYKVVIIGPVFSGKTQVSNRLTNKPYVKNYNKTVGVDFVTFEEKDTTFQLWDTSGEDILIGQTYIRESSIILVCVSLTGADPLLELQIFCKGITNDEYKKIPIYLVFTKADMSDRTVSMKEIHAFAAALGVNIEKIFYTSSVKNNDPGVTELKQAISSLSNDNQDEDKKDNQSEANADVLDLNLSKSNRQEIRKKLASSNDFATNLDNLEQAFRHIESLPQLTATPRTNRFFNVNNATYSDIQLENIAILKKVYVECIEKALKESNYKDVSIKDQIYYAAKASKLVNFHTTRYKCCITDETRTKCTIDSLLMETGSFSFFSIVF